LDFQSVQLWVGVLFASPVLLIGGLMLYSLLKSDHPREDLWVLIPVITFGIGIAVSGMWCGGRRPIFSTAQTLGLAVVQAITWLILFSGSGVIAKSFWTHEKPKLPNFTIPGLMLGLCLCSVYAYAIALVIRWRMRAVIARVATSHAPNQSHNTDPTATF
jgi:hypothetical protein